MHIISFNLSCNSSCSVCILHTICTLYAHHSFMLVFLLSLLSPPPPMLTAEAWDSHSKEQRSNSGDSSMQGLMAGRLTVQTSATQNGQSGWPSFQQQQQLHQKQQQLQPPLRRLVGHTGTVLCLAVDEPRQLLHSASVDCTIKTWSLVRGCVSVCVCRQADPQEAGCVLCRCALET